MRPEVLFGGTAGHVAIRLVDSTETLDEIAAVE